MICSTRSNSFWCSRAEFRTTWSVWSTFNLSSNASVIGCNDPSMSHTRNIDLKYTKLRMFDLYLKLHCNHRRFSFKKLYRLKTLTAKKIYIEEQPKIFPRSMKMVTLNSSVNVSQEPPKSTKHYIKFQWQRIRSTVDFQLCRLFFWSKQKLIFIKGWTISSNYSPQCQNHKFHRQ